MDGIKSFELEGIVLWGCQWRFQYERDWILDLVKPTWIKEVDWYENITQIKVHKETKVYLIESGIHTLRKNLTEEERNMTQNMRIKRINAISNSQKISIIHLSDEEGMDGDWLYKHISPSIIVWRNFNQSRFDIHKNVRNFPLGATRGFLAFNPWVKSSKRKFVWNFVGTNWPNSEREKAIKQFKSLDLGSNFLYLGEEFSRGVDSNKYKHILLDSMFTICPGGARHIETFRFYESLEAGSIPLSIISKECMDNLFHTGLPPMPIFKNWNEVLSYVNELILKPNQIDSLQRELFFWWKNEKYSLSLKMQEVRI